ncbi:MAG: NADH-quinone oxidoreductase subunit A [Planctomycetia bacterium]|nr:NADH-quinone oxidoreductase subunit A [Planctomycetia bacterium]
MESTTVPILLFVVCALCLAVGTVMAGRFFGPRRSTPVKGMPYESGMDPVHDTRRRFDVRFHLVAIAFLVFDVEVLFLYPWAVASKQAAQGDPARGIDLAVQSQLVSSREMVFFGAAAFFVLLLVGYVYDWRKGVFRWR